MVLWYKFFENSSFVVKNFEAREFFVVFVVKLFFDFEVQNWKNQLGRQACGSG